MVTGCFYLPPSCDYAGCQEATGCSQGHYTLLYLNKLHPVENIFIRVLKIFSTGCWKYFQQDLVCSGTKGCSDLESIQLPPSSQHSIKGSHHTIASLASRVVTTHLMGSHHTLVGGEHAYAHMRIICRLDICH